MRNKLFILTILGIVIGTTSCGDSDDPTPQLSIPSEYVSANYDANVTAENTVIIELAELTDAVNDAETNAQSRAVSAINYPTSLSSVTISSYQSKVSSWLPELVSAANDDDTFQNPGTGAPAEEEEGGLLGTRLLDEYGLELEQMVVKGSYGAALYNHALTVIDGELSSASIDQLVEIFGTDPTFNVDETSFASKYAKRRSNHTTGEGFFYEIKKNLITAKAAIEAGDTFNSERDQALADFKLNWEKSNFATVIFYCNASKTLLQTASTDEEKGNAMHAYAEGVAFAHGFRGVADKQITDAQIDAILKLLLAPAGETPESYKFLNDATLLANFDQVIEDIQNIYGFTDEEVTSFFVNDPS
ncbi:hypothetical protein [Ekhidna sp.]|uniref:hypothetical protein n=1 Tax=Ekhidna sp. TaxID=2608089 RepID=UPI003B50081D